MEKLISYSKKFYSMWKGKHNNILGRGNFI